MGLRARPVLPRTVSGAVIIVAAVTAAHAASRRLLFAFELIAPVLETIVLGRVDVASQRVLVLAASHERRRAEQDERHTGRRLARTGGHDSGGVGLWDASPRGV